jgi:hypothetical protein
MTMLDRPTWVKRKPPPNQIQAFTMPSSRAEAQRSRRKEKEEKFSPRPLRLCASPKLSSFGGGSAALSHAVEQEVTESTEPLECGKAIFPNLGEASPNGARFGFVLSDEKCNPCLCSLRFLLFLIESIRLRALAIVPPI